MFSQCLAVFTKAIKARYPGIRIINSSGTDPDGDRFDLLNNELRKNDADVIDEHFYRRPEWFLQNAARYDNYPRGDSKIFAGEYAAQTDKTVSINNRNNWRGAISEAAFMTGLERNAAVIHMASYAPLFAHEEGWQWKPDLIWVNNLESFGTPNYYVQQLFSTNRSSAALSFTSSGQNINGADSLYATAALDSVTNEVIIKIVNASAQPLKRLVTFEGKRKPTGVITALEMQSNDLETENTFQEPARIKPVNKKLTMKGRSIDLTIAPYSFIVVPAEMSKTAR